MHVSASSSQLCLHSFLSLQWLYPLQLFHWLHRFHAMCWFHRCHRLRWFCPHASVNMAPRQKSYTWTAMLQCYMCIYIYIYIFAHIHICTQTDPVQCPLIYATGGGHARNKDMKGPGGTSSCSPNVRSPNFVRMAMVTLDAFVHGISTGIIVCISY